MTVAELRDKLRQFNGHRQVWIRCPDGIGEGDDFPLLDAITDDESPCVFIVGDVAGQPCSKCRRDDLPLHTNGQCARCGPR